MIEEMESSSFNLIRDSKLSSFLIEVQLKRLILFELNEFELNF